MLTPVETTTENATQPTNGAEEKPQDVAPTEKLNESQPEGDLVKGDVKDDVTNVDDTKVSTETAVDPTEEINRLQAELDKYRAQDDEFLKLANQTGVQNQDPQIARAQMQLDVVNNQAQQAYIQLCNEHGVDYRPEKITESANKLLETDPKAYYDLQYKLGQLDTMVNEKRAEINNFINAKNTEIALAQYSQILNASPALKNTVDYYLKNSDGNPQEIMAQIMELAKPIYQEAFEYGKVYAQQELNKQQKASPADVLNNTPIVNNTSYTSTSAPLTLKDVEAMDVETYDKNKELIDRLWAEGKLK